MHPNETRGSDKRKTTQNANYACSVGHSSGLSPRCELSHHSSSIVGPEVLETLFCLSQRNLTYYCGDLTLCNISNGIGEVRCRCGFCLQGVSQHSDFCWLGKRNDTNVDLQFGATLMPRNARQK